MKILGLDPSSTRTGYAFLESKSVEQIARGFVGPAILDAGYLRPQRQDDAPIDRIRNMCDDLRSMFAHSPECLGLSRIVVEITSGKAGRGFRLGAGPHLAVYGMAVGAIYVTCLACRMPGVELLHPDEREWTRGVSKRKRQLLIAAEFPQYREAMAKDSGGDVADAIGLALWGMNRE